MPVVCPSLHSIVIAYLPSRLIPLARTFSGTLAGSSSGRPEVSSMQPAQRQARRRSRARYLVSWPSGHLSVMVERSRPTISSGIGMSAGRFLPLQQELEQRRDVQGLQKAAAVYQGLDLAQRHQVDADVLAGLGRGGAQRGRPLREVGV